MTDLVMHPSIAADKIIPPDRLVSDILRRHAAKRPDGLAWVTTARRWTFAEANTIKPLIAQKIIFY